MGFGKLAREAVEAVEGAKPCAYGAP